MARARRWRVTRALVQGTLYFDHLAEQAGWSLEVRPLGDYGRVARHLKSRARGRGGRRRTFFGHPEPDHRSRGRPVDPLYEEFNYEFASHLLEQVPAVEFVPHLQTGITAFLKRHGHIRSGRRRGAIDFDALTVADALLSLAPEIDAARPWRAGATAVRLYGAFLEGITGRPHAGRRG